MLNSEKRSLVLNVLRLGRFVSSMPSCLESALRRCELRHSVTLKAELRRSNEVVLAGSHFVAEISTGFEKSLIYQLLPFAFDDQSDGILVLLKKKKLRLSRFLPFSPSTRLSNTYAPFFLEKKKKKKKKGQRGSSSSGKDRYARFGINLLACILFPPSRCERRSFHSAKGIYVRKARVVIQQMTDRRGVFFSLHVTLPLWGCGTPSIGWGNFLLEGIFPLNEPIRVRLFLLAPRPKPNPVVTMSTRLGGLVRG